MSSLKRNIDVVKRFLIWLFRNFCCEISELFSWIFSRAKKIKRNFLQEFYPDGIFNNQTTELWRKDILSDFNNWLEEFSDSKLDDLKNEIDAESEMEHPNLLDFYSQLAALRQNVQSQTKADVNFNKTLSGEFENLREEFRKQNITLEKATNNFKTQIVEARYLAQKEILSELLYIHESLERCVLATENEKIANVFWHRKSAEKLLRIKENQKIVFEKSEDAIRRLNVRKIAEIGLIFNPKIMKAVAVKKDSSLADSTVTKILRQGYAVDNKIIQIAEVEVATL